MSAADLFSQMFQQTPGFGNPPTTTSSCATCTQAKKTSEFSPIDLQNNVDSYEIWVNIPGFEKECLEITIKDKVLKIVGKKPIVTKPSNLAISRRTQCDEFTYQVKLGTPVDASKTKNTIVAGVLYLKLFKSEPDEGVRIAI